MNNEILTFETDYEDITSLEKNSEDITSIESDTQEISTIEKDIEEIAIIENDSNEIVTFEENTGGTSNYNYLTNKPQINSIELIGNKTSSELKLQDEMEALSNIDIENLLNNQGGNKNGKIFG